MRLTITILTLLLGLVAPVGSVYGQAEVDTVGSLPGIQVSTSVDRAEVYVGDLINYTVSIEFDSTYELIPPPLGANLGAFDVKDYQTDIQTPLENGRIKSDNRFVLSTFTTGDYIIPPVPVMFRLPDGRVKAVLSESVPIRVESLLLNVGDSADIRPLKAQYEFQRDMTPYYFWGGAILLLLIVLGLLLWRWLRRRGRIQEEIDLRPAWEIAFERLVWLKQKGMPEKKEFKQYYIELSEIIRAYLDKMYDVRVLDMTTEEFVAAFADKDLPGETHADLKRFFNHADLVKFARHMPGAGRCEADFEEIHRLVELIRADHERKLQPEIHIANGSRTGDRLTEVGP